MEIQRGVGGETSANAAGYIIVGVLLMLTGIVLYSGLQEHYSSYRYFLASLIGFVIFGKIVISKVLRLDSERVVKGWLAFWIASSAAGLAFSALFFAMRLLGLTLGK